MMPRTFFPALVLTAVLSGCSPASTGPDPELPGSDITAIHIARGGVPVDSLIRTGTLGSMSFELLLEDRNGTLHQLGGRRAVWGSTHPSVLDEALGDGGQVFVFRQQNGRARLVAQVGEMRDSVAVEIRQVAVSARLDVDTIVTLAPGARDVTGGPTAFHYFRFAAQPVDSNGYRVDATAPIQYTPIGDASFDIFPTPRGDTLFVAGRETRDGRLAIRFAGGADTLAVQVADSYRLLRLTESSDGQPLPLPPSVTVPRGTAIIIQNNTRFQALFGEQGRPTTSWRMGPVAPARTEAQVFRSPGVYELWWIGQRCLVIVT